MYKKRGEILLEAECKSYGLNNGKQGGTQGLSCWYGSLK